MQSRLSPTRWRLSVRLSVKTRRNFRRQGLQMGSLQLVTVWNRMPVLNNRSLLWVPLSPQKAKENINRLWQGLGKSGHRVQKLQWFWNPLEANQNGAAHFPAQNLLHWDQILGERLCSVTNCSGLKFTLQFKPSTAPEVTKWPGIGPWHLTEVLKVVRTAGVWLCDR